MCGVLEYYRHTQGGGGWVKSRRSRPHLGKLKKNSMCFFLVMERLLYHLGGGGEPFSFMGNHLWAWPLTIIYADAYVYYTYPHCSPEH